MQARCLLCAKRERAMQLAGGAETTILSIVSAVLLPMFSTLEATTLRLINREFTAAVREYQWEDRETVITGEIGLWRASFPRARVANVRRRCDYGRAVRVA